MTRDDLEIALVAVRWAGAMAVLGLGVLWLLRRNSLRWLAAALAVLAVSIVAAGVFGTARAMFYSSHDYGVTLRVLVVSILVAAVAATIAGTVLARSSESVRQEARRFGESGSFTAPGRRGHAELDHLVTELERTSARLAESREREAALEQSRRELIAWVSHDLRTPLAGMRAMTEALEDGMADDPARYHRQIGSEVERMVRMVDDLFELSRVQSGALKLSIEHLSLGDLVSETIASADPVARARGVRLGGAVEHGLQVSGDPAELARVLGNLVMNAIRHTPSDGEVTVVGRAVDDGVEVAVHDGCGGIDEADMERVFDVAWQASPARRTGVEGTEAVFGSGAGLGLAIVKGIVEAHDGRVEVRNEAAGCRFLVRLP
ncbi:sensor histidine kinase [Nocardioides sp.]|uniref:sensor histidine kinase n=1 Tax=Nocardioides sp. TaxID=35761 RepID=UPI0035115B1C